MEAPVRGREVPRKKFPVRARNGNVVIQEYKSSLTAPLTNNQARAFPEIFENGGVVVGNGKGIFTGGYQIPAGTEVKIVRPN